MSEPLDVLPALKREWLVTRLVLLIGFTLALGVGTYLGVAARREILLLPAQVARKIAAEKKVAQQMHAAAHDFCPEAVKQAKTLGVLPSYATLVEKRPRRTSKPGRYLCIARTPAALYGVIGDFVCPDLKNAKCLSLFAVTQGGKNGGVIYERH